jgi:fucose permease
MCRLFRGVRMANNFEMTRLEFLTNRYHLVLLCASIVSFCLCFVIVMFALRLPVWVWSLSHSTGIAISAIICACSLLYAPSDRVFMLYVAAGFVGVNEGIGVFLDNGYMASLFPDDPSSAFSVMRSIEALNFALMAIVARFTPPLVLIIIVAVWSVLSFMSVLRLFFVVRWKKLEMEKAKSMELTKTTDEQKT